MHVFKPLRLAALLPFALNAQVLAADPPNSVRSWPHDHNIYRRHAIPEDDHSRQQQPTRGSS
jgi:hypothetical protein